MLKHSYRAKVAKEFQSAAEARGLYVKGFNISAVLLLHELGQGPIRRKKRDEPGEAAATMMGTLVKLRAATYNAETQHYEITAEGRMVLGRCLQAGLVELAEHLDAKSQAYGKGVAA